MKNIDRSKIGKQNKRKGKRAETEAANFWAKELGSKIKSTPRSGAFVMDWPGDLIDLGDSILKEYVIEVKTGKQIPKKIIDWTEKLEDEAQGKKCFIHLAPPYKEHIIVLPINVFAKLLKIIQGYEKEDQVKM